MHLYEVHTPTNTSAHAAGHPPLSHIFYFTDHWCNLQRLPCVENVYCIYGISTCHRSCFIKLSVSQRECQDLAEFVRKVLGPYSVNVTTAARLCSASLCQGKGRCVRQNPESSSAYLHLPPQSEVTEKVTGNVRQCSFMSIFIYAGFIKPCLYIPVIIYPVDKLDAYSYRES